jgi:signal recognition particle subunit SEC65
LAAGWTPEEAIGLVEKEACFRPKEISVNGVTYPSISQAAKAHGLDPELVGGRLRKGKSTEEAFSKESLVGSTTSSQAKEITVKGVTYPSIKAAVDELGLDYNLVSGRLFKGKSIEEAFSRAPLRGNGIEIVIDGTTYKSIKKASEAYGLDYKTVHYRLKNGVPIETIFGKGSSINR